MAAVSMPYGLARKPSHLRILLSLFALVLCTNSPAAYCSDRPNGQAVRYSFSVLQPGCDPELYKGPLGTTQWRNGDPIPIADTIRISVSSSPDSTVIKQVEVRVDQAVSSTRQAPPWIVDMGCSHYALGAHALMVTTELKGNDVRPVQLPLSLELVNNLPVELKPQSQAVTTSVKGIQQELSGGTVTSTAPDDGIIVPPGLAGTSKQIVDSGVDVIFEYGSLAREERAGQPVDINGSIVVKVAPRPSSCAVNFVFSLVHNGQTVYRSPAILTMSGTGIKLTAQSPTTIGLIPGPIDLYVWGVDSYGNYTSPTVVKFKVIGDGSPEMVKP